MATTTTVAQPTTTPVNDPSFRYIDTIAAMNILNKRKTVKLDHVGQQVLLTVQGNGQYLPKGFTYAGPSGVTENLFDRMIYNLVANSQLSMLRKENKLLLTEAIKAESVGDRQLAHDKFNAYLNAVQISFSVIMPSNRKFESGDMVKAVVEKVTNSAGTEQLVVNDVRLKAAEIIATTKFAVSDLLDIDEEIA